MSLNPKELELHRQLLAAIDEYIRVNLKWEEKGYRSDARRTRKALRKIIDITYLRWQEAVYTMREMDIEKGNKRGERWAFKDPGRPLMQLLNKVKNKNQQSKLEDSDDDYT